MRAGEVVSSNPAEEDGYLDLSYADETQHVVSLVKSFRQKEVNEE